MSQLLHRRTPKNREPEPVWEIAYLFPPQGHWSEEDYLALDSNHLVELNNGSIEVLPMPTTTHQFIVAYLFRTLHSFVSPRGLGTVLFAALRFASGKENFASRTLSLC